MNGGQEVYCSSVVAGGDTPKMLKLIEESFDPVPELIGLGVMWNLDFSVSFGWNDYLTIGFFNHFPQPIGVTRFVGNNAIGGLTIQ